MAHEISHESGKAEIAYAGETPWHGLGTKVDGLQTTAAMLTAAGMDWTVETRPLETILVNGSRIEVPSHRSIIRTDTNRVMGVATARYQAIQNQQMADMVDALVAEGAAVVEVAGALGHGERCWMLAQIPGAFDVVKGDEVKPYFLLAWGHDGLHGVAGKLTAVRVVCKNTLTAAGFGKGKWSATADVYIKHVKSASVSIEAARKALGLVKKQTEQTAEAYRAIAGVSMTERAAAEYFSTVFPVEDLAMTQAEAESDAYAERLAKWDAHQDALLRLFESGVGADVPGVRGTAWAAYNAVTEWTDHLYPVLKSGEISRIRQESVLFGQYSIVKERALTNALALVG